MKEDEVSAMSSSTNLPFPSLAEADLRRKLKRAAQTARTRARSQSLPSGDNKRQSREVFANKGASFQKASPK